MKHSLRGHKAGQIWIMVLILVFVTSITVRGDTEVFMFMNAEYIELEFYQTYDFDVIVKGLSCCDVTWRLDDTRYLSVDKDGVVSVKPDIVESGIGEEIVTITATSVMGDYYTTAKILVIEPPKGSVDLSLIPTPAPQKMFSIRDNFIEVERNQTHAFDIKMNGIENYDVLWTIEENPYLTIDRNGIVKFKRSVAPGELGEYYITVTAIADTGEYYDTATILLTGPPLAPMIPKTVIPRLFNTDYNPW